MSLHHMSKKSKLKSSQVVILDEYKGHEDVPENVTYVRFHPSVVDVRYDEFQGHTELREVILNEGLREIGAATFDGCTSLQSTNIPSAVTKIGYSAFSGCSNLTDVVLNEGLQEIGSSAFAYCSSLKSIAIPSTVKEIEGDTFRSCTNLREVVISDGLKSIGNRAFEDCKELQSITIPSTVDDITRYAFYGCVNLREVEFKEGFKRIEPNAFQECTSLECITIPSTITEIGGGAFYGCNSLREVVIVNHERVHFVHDSFENCTSLRRFKIPSLRTRLDNIIRAGQRDIEAKVDNIPAVEWRDELVIPAVSRQIENRWGIRYTIAEIDKEKLNSVEGLITYYEMKEASTLFELALWKARIDQADDTNGNRNAHRIEVPGPVKDVILQYLR